MAVIRGSNIFAGPADEAYARAVTYQPEGMLDFLHQMDTLSGPLNQFAAAVTLLAAKASDEFPLDKAVGEELARVGAGMAAAARAADEIGPLIRKLHAVEMKRLEQPRPGEHLWDSKANKR